MIVVKCLTDSCYEIFFSIGVIGLCIGSFLNVVIYRLPFIIEKEWTNDCCDFLKIEKKTQTKEVINLLWPRSFCPHCKKTIPFYRNIPIFSYLFSKGSCHNCKNKISIQYPLVELLTGGLILLSYAYWGLSLKFLFTSVLICGLIVLSFIDLKKQYLPDTVVYPLLWGGLLANAFSIFCTAKEAIIGGIFGYTSLWLVVKLFFILTKKEGMGHGDFKLFALIGAWLGWSYLPLTILLSSFLGALIGSLYLKFSGQSQQTPIPFGPYLCFAALVSLFWGETILTVYSNYLL